MLLFHLRCDQFKRRILRGSLIGLLSGAVLGGCGPQAVPTTPTAVESVMTQTAPAQATPSPSETDAPQTPVLRMTSTPFPTAEVTKTLSPEVIQATLTASAPFIVISIAGVEVVACSAADCGVLRSLKLGDMVQVVDTHDEWHQIMFVDGATGFIPVWVVDIPIVLPSLAPTIAFTPIPTVTDCTPRRDWPVYTVQAGETLSQIAARARSTAQDIADANCLLDINVVTAGQKLYVPIAIFPPVLPTLPPEQPNPNATIFTPPGPLPGPLPFPLPEPTATTFRPSPPPPFPLPEPTATTFRPSPPPPTATIFRPTPPRR